MEWSHANLRDCELSGTARSERWNGVRGNPDLWVDRDLFLPCRLQPVWRPNSIVPVRRNLERGSAHVRSGRLRGACRSRGWLCERTAHNVWLDGDILLLWGFQTIGKHEPHLPAGRDLERRIADLRGVGLPAR